MTELFNELSPGDRVEVEHRITVGPRLITPETKAEMKRILAEIQDGRFAREWILENKAGAPSFKALRRRERNHLVEQVGRGLRRLMSWINAKEV